MPIQFSYSWPDYKALKEKRRRCHEKIMALGIMDGSSKYHTLMHRYMRKP